MVIEVTRKKLFVLLALVVVIISVPLTVFLSQQQQIFQPHAWFTSQSAQATCDISGKVSITVKFTNTEPVTGTKAMNVLVKDIQSNSQVDLGKINPGETKTATIQTSKDSLSAGAVQFLLTWSDGHAGTDSRSANYSAVSTCLAPTPTPTQVITPSLTPSVTPTLTPSPTPSPTPSNTPTPTPTACVVPHLVTNVKVSCPSCFSAQDANNNTNNAGGN